MSESLGPLDIDCDSPPYSIVQASQRVGVQNPEDVRWCRISRYLREAEGWREALRAQGWKSLFGMNQPGAKKCVCGKGLPNLERCEFTYISGREVAYLMGQCVHCFTVYWEESR